MAAPQKPGKCLSDPALLFLGTHLKEPTPAFHRDTIHQREHCRPQWASLELAQVSIRGSQRGKCAPSAPCSLPSSIEWENLMLLCRKMDGTGDHHFINEPD